MKFFTQFFARFINSRRAKHLFKIGQSFGSHAHSAMQGEAPQSLALHINSCANTPLPELYEQLKTSIDGLNNEQVEAIRLITGPNQIEHEKPLSAWLHLWLCYKNPFNLLLTVLAFISFLTDDIQATIVIGIMVVLSTLIRFIQEGKSNRAAENLIAMVTNTASVIRQSKVEDTLQNPTINTTQTTQDHSPFLHSAAIKQTQELPIQELVQGDMIVLSAGDMIPADCRVIVAKDLFVSQAAMTGESLPIEKFSDPSHNTSSNPIELSNILFMGTNVVSGSATAVVISTGNLTYFGTIATRVTAADRAPTAFQSGVNSVSWLLIRFALVMVPIVLLVNGFTKGDWTEAFLFALAVAVGLTPEMLPMIVTSTLAKGAVILSRKKVIVKRLDAIQNFGAMDVLCTDKTGTLTQDKIFLSRHTDIFGNDSDEVLEFAYVNSYFQTGLKNLLDRAVLDHVELQTELKLAQDYQKIDEIPFDFERRRMSVVVSERQDHHELICKGAVEEILSICTHVKEGDNSIPLDASMLARVLEVTQNLNNDGLRVVAVAVKEVPPSKITYSIKDEDELTLIGYIAFLDPPKESTAPALAALAKHGVHVKVLTGDNELVTAKICREVGLTVNGVILGAQIDALDDAQLARVVEDNNIFAKLNPLHKERLVRMLRHNGHIVGFMGDGINDAPAIRAADIGISVDSAVDIAKEAADIILLEKSLMVLEEGVLEGRKTFSNMLKYIRMTASSNFGNVFSVLVASAFLPFLPMLPLQLLVQNLLYDISQIAIPFDNVDDELIEQPLKWNPGDIGRFMLFFGPLSSVFDIATFVLMWFVFHADSVANQTLFQSGWFVVGLLTQTLIVHMIRTSKIPFIQSRAAWPLTVMTVIIMIIGVSLPMSPLAGYFKLEALPLAYFPCLALILLGYVGLVQTVKHLYTKRYGWQ